MTEATKVKKSTIEKLQNSREEVFVKQESAKSKTTESILDKFFESDEEYDSRLAELRGTDIIRTRQLKLRNINIPGHKTIWASTDPKAHPSFLELQSRGYRAVKGYDLVPTGHHSVDGASFHVLMTIPEDLAKKRQEALEGISKKEMELVKQTKTNLNAESEKDFMFEQNKFEKPKILSI